LAGFEISVFEGPLVLPTFAEKKLKFFIALVPWRAYSAENDEKNFCGTPLLVLFF
jgi:hypothetical protein